MNPTTQLRREIAQAYAERDRAKRDHDKTLKTWTDERSRMLEQIRGLRKRERVLIKLLTDYLAGDLDHQKAVDKLQKTGAR